MGKYRNFEMTTYSASHGTKFTTKERLEEEIAWFEKYLQLDNVYLEAFRGDCFASEEQVRMDKETSKATGSSGSMTFQCAICIFQRVRVS